MVAAIRHIWGPYCETLVRVHRQGRERDIEVRWYFHGVRSDGTMARWVLIYDVVARRWLAQGLATAEKPPLPDRMDAMLPRKLAEMPVFSGKVVDILRKRLPPEAFATAVRLTAAAPW